MKHQKRILSLLLAVLILATTLFATGCDAINLLLDKIRGQETEETTPESTTPENTTPENTTPDATTPEDNTPVTPPSVFDGIEFSDPAVVIPAAYALATGATLEGTHTLKGKVTVILTTHYMEEAEALSDRIGIMKDGRLLVVATVEEIKRDTGCDRFEDAFLHIVKGKGEFDR